MTADASPTLLLTELARLGVRLQPIGDRLAVSAPRSVLTQDLQAAIAHHKRELLVLLRSDDVPPGAAPLTTAQEQLWSLVRVDEASSRHHVHVAHRLRGRLDVRALGAALQDVVSRHDVLRTRYPGTIPADVSPEVDADYRITLERADVGAEDLFGAMTAWANRPFDVVRGPLWRAGLFRVDQEDHALTLTFHHLIFDGQSRSVLISELAEGYRAHRDGRPPERLPLTIQFGDLARQERRRHSELTAQHLDYWRQHLEGVARLQLPRTRSRSGMGRSAHLPLRLTGELAARLADFCREHRTSPFPVLTAALLVLLHRHTGQTDLVVCAPTAGRRSPAAQELIGFFNTVLPLRVDVSDRPTFTTIVADVRRAVAGAVDHDAVTLHDLARVPELARTSLTTAMVSYQDLGDGGLALPDVEVEPLILRRAVADTDFAVHLERWGTSIRGVVDFDTAVLERDEVVVLMHRYNEFLEMLLAEPGLPIDALPAHGPSDQDVADILSAHPQVDEAAAATDPASGTVIGAVVLDEDDPPEHAEIARYAARSLPHYRVPVELLPVGHLPRKPDGELDRLAIRALSPARIPHSADRPQSPEEQLVADVWRRVLWLDGDVGRHDSFLALGGHSLLAVQMVHEIERQSGSRVPTSALIEVDDLARFAAALGDPALETPEVSASGLGGAGSLSTEILAGLLTCTSTWSGYRLGPDSVIVGLNTDGTRQPLFWCLQSSFEHGQLARYLGTDQPVYGMRSGHLLMEKTEANIVAVAHHYADEILSVQPRGPYLLGGNCQAAVIALHAARRLRSLGHEISLLFLQEKFWPLPYDSPTVLLFGDRSDRNPWKTYRDPEIGWRKVYTGPLAASEISGGHGKFFGEPHIQVLAATLRRHMEHPPGGSTLVGRPLPAGGAAGVLPADAYRARLTAVRAPSSSAPGAPMTLTVDIRNESRYPWPAWSQSGLSVGCRWRTGASHPPLSVADLVRLPTAVAEGEVVRVDVAPRAPRTAHPWMVEVDMVDEGFGWFQDRGSDPLRLRVDVS